jgi:streptomycin 6-kinase
VQITGGGSLQEEQAIGCDAARQRAGFRPRGWLAIDPKRLLGDRAFDYTTMFSNPDLCGPGIHVATRPERFAARLEQVSAGRPGTGAPAALDRGQHGAVGGVVPG